MREVGLHSKYSFLVCGSLNNLKHFRKLWFVAVSWVVAGFVYADTQSKDILGLSIDELLQVTVVSGTLEKVSNSPGVVSVYYPDELAEFGIHSLPELLDFAAGIDFNRSFLGSDIVEIRGLFDARNQKVLLLLDGVPYWMPSHGSIPLTGLPFVSIQKVEIIRGPASVKYGTNSSAGVINIVTRKDLRAELAVDYASFNQFRTGYRNQFELKAGSLSLTVEKQVDNGFDTMAQNTFAAFDPSCFCFPLIAEEPIERKTDYSTFLTQFQSDRLKLVLQSFESSNLIYSSANIFSPTIETEKGTLFGFDYQMSLNSSELRFFSDWNRYYWERDVTNILGFLALPGDGRIDFDNNGSGNYRLRSGAHWQMASSDRLDWTVGLELERRSTENNKFRDDQAGANLVVVTQPPLNFPFNLADDGSVILIDQAKINERAFFVQTDYTLDSSRLVSGVRFIDNEFSGSQVAPRISWVNKIDNHQTFKILYAEGFNSPTFRQITARNSFGIVLPSQVSAETIKNLDFQYSITQAALYQAASMFVTHAEDLILSTQAAITNNPNLVKRSGLEYEIKYSAAKTSLDASVSYVRQGNRESQSDPSSKYVPRWTLNLGLAHHLANQQSVGLTFNFMSRRAEVSSHSVVNLTYQKKWQTSRVYLNVNNLFDRDIWHPDLRGLSEREMNVSPGRYLSAGFQLVFD